MCACIQKFHLIIYFFLPWWKWFCDIISLLYRLHSKHPRWKTKENTKHTKHHEDVCHPLEQQPLILAIKPISIIAPMALTKFSIWLSQNVHALSLSLTLYIYIKYIIYFEISTHGHHESNKLCKVGSGNNAFHFQLQKHIKYLNWDLYQSV